MTIEELGHFGLEAMDDDTVEAFLRSMSLGILGLPSDDAPYMLPMSYGYDGGTRLYFFYLVGEESRKVDLSTAAETASFLVYNAETLFTWRSVYLTGTLHLLSEEKRAELSEAQIPTWRPEIFETASESEATQLVEFRITDWTGIRQTGLPPAFRVPGDDAN